MDSYQGNAWRPPTRQREASSLPLVGFKGKEFLEFFEEEGVPGFDGLVDGLFNDRYLAARTLDHDAPRHVSDHRLIGATALANDFVFYCFQLRPLAVIG